jgi:signal transduction histidine kinase
MENHRNKSRANLNKNQGNQKIKFLKLSFLISSGISAVILIIWLLYPLLISSNYYQNSLHQLRNKSNAIKKEFSSSVKQLLDNHNILKNLKIPEDEKEIFSIFEKFQLNKSQEGIAYYDELKQIKLWSGKVIDIQQILLSPKNNKLPIPKTFLIKDKASVYLISINKTNRETYFAFYYLLAFLPQFRAQYLQEYHFLKDELMSNCKIDYWDFREDISGFERIFAKHNDEYIGQPRLQNKIQTIFFPLRNEQNHIMATVTLSSPPLTSIISTQKQNILLVFYLFLILSLILLLIYIMKTAPFSKNLNFIQKFLIILIMIGIRLIFLPMSRLERVQSLSIFSPSTASFISLDNLTKSPADIFLTSLWLASILWFFLSLFKKSIKTWPQKYSYTRSIILCTVSSILSVFLIHILYKLIYHLGFNTKQTLLNLSSKPSFFLLHISILFFVLSFFFTAYIIFKTTYSHFTPKAIPFTALAAAICAYIFMFDGKNPVLIFFLQASVLFLLLALIYYPHLSKKKELLFSIFVISVLFIHSSLHFVSADKKKAILEHSLKNTVTSQEEWAVFLIQESIQEIQENQNQVLAFFQSHKPLDIASSLWKRSLIAKFNWYSSLEFISPEGNIISRFSLNIPNLQTGADVPFSKNWAITRQSIPFLGQEKQFLSGYKDWIENDQYRGRTIISLSVGYEMLPFLYSANPYFELTRATSIPSLKHLNLGFAVFDLQGKLIFNPNNISKGISSKSLKKIHSSNQPVWSIFSDKGKKFKSLSFIKENSIYSFFIPQKTFMTHTAEFLITFFLYFFFTSLITFIFFSVSHKKRLKNPLWSFSNRVYISFIVVSLLPLLLFSVLTRSFFSQIFTQQLTEEAEVQAQFAHSIMEDFIFFQQEEELNLSIPPDEMVIWISSTISNDVNLYVNGKLVSSSHREFFDYGILPELINGDIYYKAQYQNNPFYTQTQKIGEYSFHTLTIPYGHQNSFFLISLPFPLEQEEISAFSYELFEFLVFISFFFTASVLVLARGIGGMILNPIQKLLSGTKEVSLGNLEVSIPYKKQDEMKTLIEGFNTMVISLRKHQQELADISKKIAWAEMARKVAHEIKNPLTPIQLSAEHLMRVYEDRREDFEKVLKESTSYIVNEVENLRRIAQDFLETPKKASLQKETLNLKEIIKETTKPYKSILSERIKFEEIFDKQDLFFSGDKAKIKTVFRNILTNAIESIKDSGVIEIKASSTNSEIKVEIKDTGMGVEKQMLNTIFESYFSTKKGGTGLGLPIAKKILEDHGGTISATLNKPKGLIISMTLEKVKS